MGNLLIKKPFRQKRMDDSYLFYKASGELAVLTRQFCECNFVSVKRTSIKKLKSHTKDECNYQLVKKHECNTKKETTFFPDRFLATGTSRPCSRPRMHAMHACIMRGERVMQEPWCIPREEEEPDFVESFLFICI